MTKISNGTSVYAVVDNQGYWMQYYFNLSDAEELYDRVFQNSIDELKDELEQLEEKISYTENELSLAANENVNLIEYTANTDESFLKMNRIIELENPEGFEKKVLKGEV